MVDYLLHGSLPRVIVARLRAARLSTGCLSASADRFLRGRLTPTGLRSVDQYRQQDTRLVEDVQWDRLQRQRDCVAGKERGHAAQATIA